MRKAYRAARPVSDPVASRNATLKMIAQCFKYQPHAEEYARASHLDGLSAYTTLGIRDQESGHVTPAMAIKEISDMALMKKVFPTKPVPLCPSDWLYTDNGWVHYESPDWRTLLQVEFPPNTQWFTLRPQENVQPVSSDPVEVRDAAADFLRRNLEVPPAIAAAWERIRAGLHEDVLRLAESRLRQIEYNGRIVTVDPEHPATITFTEN